jgi:hypothetical protein
VDLTQKTHWTPGLRVGCPCFGGVGCDRRRRPGCRTAGLIRSLSAPLGVTHHSLAPRLPRPINSTVNLSQEVSDGHARRPGGQRARSVRPRA